MAFSRRFVSVALLTSMVLPAATITAIAQEMSPVPGKRVALRGYDPVAYFTRNQPVKGSSSHWSDFDDAVYFFESDANRAAFAAAPDKFAPQYAGYCTGGIAFGVKTEADPFAWIISDGKLFVFGSPSDVPDFAADPNKMVASADANWHRLHIQH
jgi:YHS domain-containing protein